MKSLNKGLTGISWRHFVTFLAGAVATGGVDLAGDGNDIVLGLIGASLAFLASVVNKKGLEEKIAEEKGE